MPVSVVCESSANVNAALRESLGGGTCSAAAVAVAEDAKSSVTALAGAAAAASGVVNSTDDVDSLQSKLVASAKRVLLSKIDYEEVSSYGQSVLDTLKSKYIVLKPCPTNGSNNNVAESGRASPAICNNNNNNNGTNGHGDSSTADTNGNTISIVATSKQRPTTTTTTTTNNLTELPQPKRVLYPRENVRIGWKNGVRKWEVGVGMMNVGNTCYLNSTLQALFHVPAMANWLMTDTQHMERCDAADVGCIICAMAKTLQDSQNSQSAIRPYFVYSKLKSICKHLVMGRQEDAHEFLRYLVEAMEKSYLSRFRNYKELDQYSKETTPLNQILGGYLKSAVRCLSCSHVSVTFQHFQDLLLDIRKADTIEEALEGYFARERLEDMGYKCEACKRKVSATKQFSLERAPIALCIQLKRFSMLGTKLNKQITIKPRLDLTKYVSRKQQGEQLTYRLVAMVTHLGASQHCGHYTAIGLTESGTYYNYDDSYVRPISLQNVCNTNAYIIFYEMDTTPSRQITSTQVGTSAMQNALKEQQTQNQQQHQHQHQHPHQALKVNGHALAGSPQRMIGPQLPSSGLQSYTNGTSALNNGSKLSINRTTSIPTSSSVNNSKIMIHFKNNAVAVKSSAANSPITSATTTSTTSTPSNQAFDNLKNGVNNNTMDNTNGLHVVGTDKLRQPTAAANTKSPLSGAANKKKMSAGAVTNGNDSSSSDDESESENAISSSSATQTATPTTLPSMPKLGAESSSPAPMLANGVQKKAPVPLKSLVPYGSETDDETDTAAVAAAAAADQKAPIQNTNNPLKRRQSNTSSSSFSDDLDEENNDAHPTNGAKMKKAATSGNLSPATTTTSNCNKSLDCPSTTHNGCNTTTRKVGAIDDIFDSLLKGNTSDKKHQQQQQQQNKSQIEKHVVTSTTPAADSSSDSEDNGGNCSATRPPFKRSHSTPPSPPVIKTKTGLWQVTSLQPVSACVSPTTPPTTSSLQALLPSPDKTPKNPKNPFATKSNDTLNAKRPKMNAPEKAAKTFAGNGYQRGTSSDSAVSELLKQSHRGYGAPVLSWNGQQTEIEREIIAEAREQRQRDWEDEEENEMDRGRQKKVKAGKDPYGNMRSTGYNPFQEVENQTRWKRYHHVGGGGGGGGGYFRQHFQRNKFKFQRFQHRFQHAQKRNPSNGAARRQS